MSARLLKGSTLAKSIRADIKDKVSQRQNEGLRVPGVAVILVGEDEASKIYVAGKERDCQEVGILSRVEHLPSNTTQEALDQLILALNKDPVIDGILVQLPLPAHLDDERIIELIDAGKDVDGFHPYNIGRLASRKPLLRSCTPKGIIQLIESTEVPLRGLNATVVGASNHVGRPMSLELLLAGCTVTTAHRFTKTVEEHVQNADVLVTAVGRPGIIPGAWIKPGAIVVDVGITRDKQGKLHGDVEFAEARKVAGWITPVPGGVGPMTRVAVLQNALQIVEQNDH